MRVCDGAVGGASDAASIPGTAASCCLHFRVSRSCNAPQTVWACDACGVRFHAALAGSAPDPLRDDSPGHPGILTTTTLLLPSEAARDALLREGSYGARVLMMSRYPRDHCLVWVECDGADDGHRKEYALVLVRTGIPVAEGCDRAARVAGWSALPATWSDADVAALYGHLHGLGALLSLNDDPVP